MFGHHYESDFKRLFYANRVFEKEISFWPSLSIFQMGIHIYLSEFCLCGALDCTGYFGVNETPGIIAIWGVLTEKVSLWLSPWAVGVHIYFTAPAMGIEVDWPPLAAVTKHHKLSGLKQCKFII